MGKHIWKATWLLLAAAHAFFAVKLLGGVSFIDLSVIGRLGALFATIGFCAFEALDLGPISWLLSQSDWRGLAIAAVVIALLHGAVPGRYMADEGAVRVPPQAVMAIAIIPVAVAAGLGAFLEWLRRIALRESPELVPVRIKRKSRYAWHPDEGASLIRRKQTLMLTGLFAPQPPPSK